jgi:hypothetical protein
MKSDQTVSSEQIMKVKIGILLLVILAALSLTADIAWAQDYTTRLRPPASDRFVVGGESHISYVVRARRGQRMTVRISWIRRHYKYIGNNNAEFWVGDLPDFDGDGRVEFGKKSEKGRRWSGRIPRTGDYYIYVVAYPIAHYTLRVTLK